MTTRRLLVLAMGVWLALGAWNLSIVAQEGRGGQAATKENLDLPFDAFANSEEEEEAPEVIFFYGQQYEGDGFYFCLDRSGSTANGELDIEKRETIRTIQQFSKKVYFAIVFYDQGLMKWPSTGRPAEASGGMKAQAVAWLSTIRSGSGTCVREGLMESLNFANRSPAKHNQIIYLGDGGTTCQGHNAADYGRQTLAQVTAANFKRHTLNAICAGTDLSATDENFCKTLASLNGGTYKRVPR
jgi:hypothetical protein